MNNKNIVQYFYEHQFLPALDQKMTVIEGELQRHQEQWIDQFLETFKRICLRIREMQDSDQKGPISLIHFCLLRRSMMDHSCYFIEAYSERWYENSAPLFEEYDAAWLYHSLPAFIQQMTESYEGFGESAKSTEFEAMMQKAVGCYHLFAVALLRAAMPEAIMLEEYKSIKRELALRISIGEYTDLSEDVLVDYQGLQDVKEIRRRLEESKASSIAYGCYRNLMLPQVRAESNDLRYADFSGSHLQGSRFQRCDLMGTRWNGCLAPESDFRYSSLPEADFRHADLRGAVFDYVSGHEPRDRLRTGLMGVRFDHADLEGASFIGATFGRTSFEGANLQHALFSRQIKDSYSFSAEQIHSIRWVD
ncbi:pentapeptide repeat-containing protein [Paenibacillus sp. FSL H8-0537]|uniref:pentapeptide repeat-containing protein n=1 Tax=Paenibacillus sp. FSL H8-0537 TaxID=2921399 RepID=UPI003100B4C4